MALAASQALGDLLAGNGALLVDHIELLFDPLLQIDPLRALKLASRRRRLLVVWPGRLDDGGALTYAEPGHPEYRFEALKRVLERSDSVYVPGYRIWSHEVAWPGHGVTRPGYLFFGAPNERSTAQPPRDFYLYFIQPYEPPAFEDRQQPDKVFFRLTGRDEAFEQALQTFAGAQEMALVSSGEHKQAYLRKGDEAVQALQRLRRDAGAEDAQRRPALQRELESLKGDYMESYMTLHGRARLGQPEDQRKRLLLADRKLKGLRTLSAVHVLPDEQLSSRVTDRLGRPVACWRLVPSDLRQQPVCPHCGFRPAAGDAAVNATAEIDCAEAELDALAAAWTQMLLVELGRPEVAATVELLDGEKRSLVQTFLSEQTLPDTVSDPFVVAVNDALQGLERLAIPAEDLLLALAGDGTPCSPEEFRRRFAQFVAGRLGGHSGDRLRISLDW